MLLIALSISSNGGASELTREIQGTSEAVRCRSLLFGTFAPYYSELERVHRNAQTIADMYGLVIIYQLGSSTAFYHHLTQLKSSSKFACTIYKFFYCCFPFGIPLADGCFADLVRVCSIPSLCLPALIGDPPGSNPISLPLFFYSFIPSISQLAKSFITHFNEGAFDASPLLFNCSASRYLRDSGPKLFSKSPYYLCIFQSTDVVAAAEFLLTTPCDAQAYLTDDEVMMECRHWVCCGHQEVYCSIFG